MFFIHGQIIAPNHYSLADLTPWLFTAYLLFFILQSFKNRNFKIFRLFTMTVLFTYLYELFNQIMLLNVFHKGDYQKLIYLYKGFGKSQFFELNPLVGFTTGFNLYQLIGNFVMLMPLAILLPLLWEKFEKFKYTLIAIFETSLLIETVQAITAYFYISGQLFDTNDLLMNTLGGILGFLIFKIFKILTTKFHLFLTIKTHIQLN